MAESSIDLSLATFEDIIQELKRRIVPPLLDWRGWPVRDMACR